jgi:excisionase family DNA binding protein
MENYWRVDEVASALQISVQSVYRYVANSEIPYHKLNRSVRFRPSEIERWIESKLAGVPAARSENFDEGVMEIARTEGGEA